MEELKYFSTLGVGGALAAMALWMYRTDRTRADATFEDIVARLQAQNSELMTVVKDNTKAMTQLSDSIRIGTR